MTEASTTSAAAPRIAVIGGGISGLAAAHRVLEVKPQARLAVFEAAGRAGGILETVARDGFLFEGSADGFITSAPWGVEFCQKMGLADELIRTDESRRKAFVVCRGKLEPVPAGFVIMEPRELLPLLASRILSPAGKLRLAREWFIKVRTDETDESIGAFATRRLGRETYERLVQPLVGGIYAGDPMQLSLAATMPQFAAMERQHGGLIRAARRTASRSDAATGGSDSAARYSLFTAPRRGMGSLVEAAVARLPVGAVRLNARVTRMEPFDKLRAGGGSWCITAGRGAAPEIFDAVILATPVAVAAELMKAVHPELARGLGAIDCAGTAVVSLAYRRAQIRHALDGFGFVSPFVEKRAVFAGSFLSQKYEGRAPAGTVLIRAFVGGSKHPERVPLPDGELVDMAQGELAELLGIAGEPIARQVARWDRKMPQYAVGHLERVRAIEQAAASLPRFALAGNAYRGVGVPQCIRSGELAAERVVG